MNLPELSAFVAVAEAGTVRAAAERLALSQPALSRRVQRLEAQLGVQLFIRTGQRLRLSEAGARLLAEARTHFEALDRALNAVRDAARYGTAAVTVGCSATLCAEILPPALVEYARTHPRVQVRILDLPVSQIEQAVRNSEADFALTVLGVEEPGLVQDVLAEEPLVLLAPASHPLAGRSAVNWAELQHPPLIATGLQSANRRLLERVQTKIGMALEWRHEVQRLSTAVELVAAGIGLTVLPLLSATAYGRADLRAISLTGPPMFRRIGILRRRGAHLSAAADTFRRMLAARVRQRLKHAADATR